MPPPSKIFLDLGWDPSNWRPWQTCASPPQELHVLLKIRGAPHRSGESAPAVRMMAGQGSAIPAARTAFGGKSSRAKAESSYPQPSGQWEARLRRSSALMDSSSPPAEADWPSHWELRPEKVDADPVAGRFARRETRAQSVKRHRLRPVHSRETHRSCHSPRPCSGSGFEPSCPFIQPAHPRPLLSGVGGVGGLTRPRRAGYTAAARSAGQSAWPPEPRGQ